MDSARPEPPEAFVELVRDALLHLYDRSYLQTHPLVAAATADGPDGAGGQRLRRAILDAMDALQPEPGTDAASRAWRAVRILELRYVEGVEVAGVMEKVALGKSQYHREHHRALLALSSLLWERWAAPGEPPPAGRDELTERELRLVAPAGGVGPIDPVEVTHGVGRLLAPLCNELGVTLRLALPERLPPIRGERVALRQALMSVVAHAVEAGDGAVEVAGGQVGERVELTVIGAGLKAPEALARGLAESRPFVEALGGELTATPPAAGRPWAVRLAFPIGHSRALLVVDNNDDFVHLVRRFLAGQAWEVVGAADIDQAADLVERRPPRAILLDIVLPGRDGWELLTELRRRPAARAIPVLVCTVLDEPAVARSLGAAGYLQKPIDRRRLMEALAAIG